MAGVDIADMATNNAAPSHIVRIDSAKKYVRLKEAAWSMSVSYMWLYTKVMVEKALPHVRRGKLILLPFEEFKIWSQQDSIDPIKMVPKKRNAT